MKVFSFFRDRINLKERYWADSLIAFMISSIIPAIQTRIICDVVADNSLPILTNINVGHATPGCIIPFGVHAAVDADAQRIAFNP